MDNLAFANIGGVLGNLVIGFWTPESYTYAICNVWSALLAARFCHQLENFSNPIKALICFQLFCAVFVYFLYNSCDFVFSFIGNYVSVFGISISRFIARLQVINFYSSRGFQFAELIWREASFQILTWFLGTYSYVMIVFVMELSILFSGVYFALPENHLNLFFNLLCAMIPALALVNYGCKFLFLAVSAVFSYVLS